MRQAYSTYDQRFATATASLLDALRSAGYIVQTTVTGSVIVDGTEYSAARWDAIAVEWDGTEDGIIDIL